MRKKIIRKWLGHMEDRNVWRGIVEDTRYRIDCSVGEVCMYVITNAPIIRLVVLKYLHKYKK